MYVCVFFLSFCSLSIFNFTVIVYCNNIYVYFIITASPCVSCVDNIAPYGHRSLVVEEGKLLNLSCAATGNPAPRVEWRRDDGRTINVNGVESK